MNKVKTSKKKVKIDPELKEFGKNLRKFREERGLSQRDVAQNCTIDHSDIAKYERGETNPTFTKFLELARALELTSTEILTIVPVDSK
jgi:transcriptional regulator with XRE-family HTH domain